MTPERFAAILDAYGADPRRWPETEREAARALAAGDGGELRREAEALDVLLDASPRPAVSAALRDRVLASAAEAGLKARRATRFWLDRLVWAAGAGWATAACAGVAAGVLLTQDLAADVQADQALYTASLAADELELIG